MKLIDEIIELLSADAGNLTEALIKTKILLHKIGQKDLVEWVNNELNGYDDPDLVPEYRILGAQVLGNLASIAWQVTAHPIPVMHLSDSYRESLEVAKMAEPLAVLEQFASGKDKKLRRPIPLEANFELGKTLADGVQIQSAWSEIQISGVTRILTTVRSRLLDFLLELNEEFGGDLDDEQVEKLAKTSNAENIFNHAIFGDNATVILGSGNSTKVTATVSKGDFESLAKTLRDNAVADEEIEELKGAIALDATNQPPSKGEFGPAVKSWMQKMLYKAVEASWQVELGIASSLLATALQRFYGWI